MGAGIDDSSDLKLSLERIRNKNPDEMSDYQRQLLDWTKNVDKRYAWVVLAALFTMMGATLGPYRVYGLIFAKVTSEGVYTREEASMPVSALFTVENIFGPLVSIVGVYISAGQSMLIGGILLTLGNGLAAFSNNMWLDTFLIGFVQGLGYSFIFMRFMEVVNNYFLRYRNLALGIALSGGTVFVFVLSPFFQWFLQEYPWRYSYIAIGCVCFLNVVMVPLLRPNPRPQLSDHIAKAKNVSSKQESSQAGDNDRAHMSKASLRALSYQNSLRRQSTILIARQTNVSSSAVDDNSSSHRGVQRQASVISVNPFASSAGLERKISRTLNDSSPRVESGHQNSSPVAKQAAHNQLAKVVQSELFETVSLSEVGLKHDSEFDSSIIWNVLKTPGFHLIWYNELIFFWVFSIYCLVMVDYGVDRGLSTHQAESLLGYQSVGELFGRLVLTAIVDMQFLSNRNTTVLVLCIMAGMLVLITQVQGIIWIAAITVGISSLMSLLYIMLNGLLVDFLGERQVTIGYGMASCIGGVLMSFRPQAVGYFRDNLGSYDLLMVTLAGSCAFGVLMWCVEPCVTRLCCRKSEATDSFSV